jgi:hypothetical protein
MKPSAAVVLLTFLWSISGAAWASCEKLEYAEMDAMPKEDLLRMRCDYHHTMIAPEMYQAGSYGLAVTRRCSTEITRMDRILGRKYDLKAGDPALPYFAEVSALCRSPAR